MKSLVEEASSVVKAIEKAWTRAGKPQSFSIKIVEEPVTGFLGMVKKSAKVGIFFEEAATADHNKEAPRQQSSRSSHQNRPQHRRPLPHEGGRRERSQNERPASFEEKPEQQRSAEHEFREVRENSFVREHHEEGERRESRPRYQERESRYQEREPRTEETRERREERPRYQEREVRPEESEGNDSRVEREPREAREQREDRGPRQERSDRRPHNGGNRNRNDRPRREQREYAPRRDERDQYKEQPQRSPEESTTPAQAAVNPLTLNATTRKVLKVSSRRYTPQEPVHTSDDSESK